MIIKANDDDDDGIIDNFDIKEKIPPEEPFNKPINIKMKIKD